MNKEQTLKAMQDDIRRRHLSLATERTYLGWVGRYIEHLRMHPDLKDASSGKKLEHFLTALARTGVAASTQNQAFNAVVYLYRRVLKAPLGKVDALRAKRGERIRYAPSRSEVRALLERVEDRAGYPTRLCTQLLYGCGLRVNECLGIRVRDVDLEQGRLTIRGAKGNKDRLVGLPRTCLDELAAQVEVARAGARRDAAAGVPIALPDALARKYRRAPFAPGWAFVFPGREPCRHPRTGEVVRYHFHAVNLQRAVRRAADAAGIESPVTPHSLRHAFATHLLEAGRNPKAIQEALGHRHLDTTMRYLHAEALGAGSPLDVLQGQAA